MLHQNEKLKPKIGRIEHRPEQIRYLSILVRSFHQIAVAVFVGAFVFSGSESVTETTLLFAAVSGMFLLVLEGLRHRQFYREVFGMVTLFKAALIGLAYHQLTPATPVLIFVFFIASLVSHAPKGIRHRLIL